MYNVRRLAKPQLPWQNFWIGQVNSQAAKQAKSEWFVLQLNELGRMVCFLEPLVESFEAF